MYAVRNFANLKLVFMEVGFVGNILKKPKRDREYDYN